MGTTLDGSNDVIRSRSYGTKKVVRVFFFALRKQELELEQVQENGDIEGELREGASRVEDWYLEG